MVDAVDVGDFDGLDDVLGETLALRVGDCVCVNVKDWLVDCDEVEVKEMVAMFERVLDWLEEADGLIEDG